jgi:hypothetical protein
MNSRRTFLLGLPIMTAGAAPVQMLPSPTLDGPDSAKTIEEIKKSVVLASQWREATFENRRFLFAVSVQGDGESYIDLFGWIYNQSFEDWRRILTLKTRNVGNVMLLVDEQKGILSLQGMANNRFKHVEVFHFDLRATNDDASYPKLKN